MSDTGSGGPGSTPSGNLKNFPNASQPGNGGLAGDAGNIPGTGQPAAAPVTASVAAPTAAGKIRPFRFIHAGDLMLHVPLSGISQYPPTWQSTLASAAYTSASRIFETAIAEQVAFVLLAGNVVDLDYGGPRAIAFLLAQFERLAQRGIQVFWCGGQHDHLERWPTALELPGNVRLFPSTLVDSAGVYRDGKLLATIYGAAYDPHRTSLKDFQASPGVGVPIALTHGPYDAAKLSGHGIRYWALGGKPKRDVSTQPSVTSAYPGPPQARDNGSPGAHGAILVSFEADGQWRTQAVDCDVARWLPISLSVAESVHIDALKDLLADRALQVTSKLPDQHLLVDWNIATTGDYSAEFRKQENHGKLLKWLRHEFGTSPGLWSVSLTFSAPQNLPKGWNEEDTLLGDFLREVARYRHDAKLPFHLSHYAGGQNEVDGVARLTRVDTAGREALLDAVLLDGIDRLGGNQT